MNGDESSGARMPPWWRGRWAGFAAAIFCVQVTALWIVSANPPPRQPPPRPVPARRWLVADAPGRSGPETWQWLFTPSVFLSPSPDDFSGPAWLQGTPLQIEVEAFAVPDRSLPWESFRGLGAIPALAARLDPGPAGQWDIPSAGGPLPSVAPVPLPERQRLLVVAGLSGRAITRSVEGVGEWPAAPGADVGPVRPVVVRVAVDERGELVEPPVVWESSEVPAFDEAAIRLVRGAHFTPRVGGGVDWGLVAVEWPVRNEAGPSPKAP